MDSSYHPFHTTNHHVELHETSSYEDDQEPTALEDTSRNQLIVRSSRPLDHESYYSTRRSSLRASWMVPYFGLVLILVLCSSTTTFVTGWAYGQRTSAKLPWTTKGYPWVVVVGLASMVAWMVVSVGTSLLGWNGVSGDTNNTNTTSSTNQPDKDPPPRTAVVMQV